ncbi:uncharacterized protein [Blastocystis hominis]|uniref:Uncharacterized protein n=1 Tax=Blastocystis hominis TaxID=12968 RepID=D8M919_BLAHO|nr:uncharacterized protein [Blastocystis hominis]CBK24558.2 unnamed protein product [Blastocystis hominis]|eukprot:XP_012898606.1 uncharacterized protein [Blastocystis hominis]
MEKQPVENDQWNNPYPLVDDDDFSKKENKDDGEKETESSDSSESDISLDTEDSEDKTAESAQPEDDMAEQMKSLFQDLFTRNGNRIQIDQINVLVMRELSKRLELGKWYQRNAAKAAEIFQSLSRRNDGTGFYDYRG